MKIGGAERRPPLEGQVFKEMGKSRFPRRLIKPADPKTDMGVEQWCRPTGDKQKGHPVFELITNYCWVNHPVGFLGGGKRPNPEEKKTN